MPQALPAETTLAQTPPLLQADLGRLAGGDGAAGPVAVGDQAAAPASDGRLVLMGVVSGAPAAQGVAAVSPAGEGLALLSVDGKAPRAFAVGAVVDGERILQSVSQRRALVGLPGQAAQLELTLAAPADVPVARPPPAPAASRP